MSEKSKMDWLIDKITKYGFNCEIQESGCNRGTILIPTGGGKSGVMYLNICYHISEGSKNPGKYVFNISAPILKLCQQLVNDLFVVIAEIFKKECTENQFQIFINSSDDASSYLSSTRKIGNVYGFNDFSKFIASPTAKFAFVISCHKSLYKFAENMDYINRYTTTFHYIDESHLVANLIDEPMKVGDSTVLMELNKADYIYAFSATPDIGVTKLINEKHKYIINISPTELINNGTILRPHCESIIEHIKENEFLIKASHCVSAMKRWKKSNPYITHKILVTCENTEHLKKLERELKDKMGYKVFSTCAKDGTMEEMEPVDPIGFINTIDTCEEDCFILHIKQLIQGIDIKTLTGCIISNRNSTISDRVKVKYVQIIGRVLRPLLGERNKSSEERIKKYGNVLFILGDEYDRLERETFNFVVNYYGLKGNDSFRFIRKDDEHSPSYERDYADSFDWFDFDKDDETIAEIDELKGNVFNFLNSKIRVQISVIKEFGVEIDDNKKLEMLDDVKKHFGFYDGQFSVNDVISDKALMDYASDIIDKFISEYE